MFVYLWVLFLDPKIDPFWDPILGPSCSGPFLVWRHAGSLSDPLLQGGPTEGLMRDYTLSRRSLFGPILEPWCLLVVLLWAHSGWLFRPLKMDPFWTPFWSKKHCLVVYIHPSCT